MTRKSRQERIGTRVEHVGAARHHRERLLDAVAPPFLNL